MAAADATDVAQRTRVFTHGWNVDIQRAVALNEIGHAMKHLYIYIIVCSCFENTFFPASLFALEPYIQR